MWGGECERRFLGPVIEYVEASWFAWVCGGVAVGGRGRCGFRRACPAGFWAAFGPGLCGAFVLDTIGGLCRRGVCVDGCGVCAMWFSVGTVIFWLRVRSGGLASIASDVFVLCADGLHFVVMVR